MPCSWHTSSDTQIVGVGQGGHGASGGPVKAMVDKGGKRGGDAIFDSSLEVGWVKPVNTNDYCWPLRESVCTAMQRDRGRHAGTICGHLEGPCT